MGEVLQFKPRPVCTNDAKTCTHENCPLKDLERDQVWPMNCMGWITAMWDWWLGDHRKE